MNFASKFLWICPFFLFLISCSLFPQVEPTPPDLSYPPELEAVNKLIKNKKYTDARFKAEDYLNRSENIHWFGHAYFLKAYTYELENKLEKAIQSYRSAIQHSAGYDSRVEATALYNLSFVFEKMQRQEELLGTLIDLMKRRSFFDTLTGQVELPARLAAVYAAQGKIKEASLFHKEASGHFDALIRKRGFQASREELSRSLYYLGLAIFPEKKQNYTKLIQKLSIGQKYFLASAEASDSSWSEKATNQLSQQYNLAWGMVQGLQVKQKGLDPMAVKKQKHNQQLLMSSSLYDLAYRLKAEEFPLSQVNRRSKKVIDQANAWITKIEKFVGTLSLGPEMTRSKKIKNTKLGIYIEKKAKPVSINKEKIEVVPTQKEKSPEKLPEKKVTESDIGKDPNL